jgi:serine/threonine protein kinase
VLVTSSGVVKLIDFGISKPLAAGSFSGEQTPLTQAHQKLLTPDYASPERILGRELETTSDVYSLSVLLFELLTDTRPYDVGELSPGAVERVVRRRGELAPGSATYSDRDRLPETRPAGVALARKTFPHFACALGLPCAVFASFPGEIGR